MASYVINGASTGIGFEFLRQLSANPANTVIGLVRNVKLVAPKAAAEINRSNVHILHGDLDSYESQKKASEDTAKITGGSLDCLIANGARLPTNSYYVGFGGLGEDHAAMEEEMLAVFKSNVIGNVNLFNLFMPLILKGQQKKVAFISSGHADLEFIRTSEIESNAPYSVNKAAGNIVVAKFGAEYAKQGVLFISISPGVVDTGHFDPSKLPEHELQKAMEMNGKMQKLYPHFKGMDTVESSVRDVLSVIEKKSVANGDGGDFISHLGTRQWV